MTKIKVDESDNLFVDGNPKEVADLKSDFLEQLVKDSLEDTVEYDLDESYPLGKFFKQIKDGTAEESELRKRKVELENRKASASASDEASDS